MRAKRTRPAVLCPLLAALVIAAAPARAQLRIEAPGGVAAQSIENSPIAIYQKDPEALKLLAQMLDKSEAGRKAAEQKASELARQLDLTNVTGKTVLGFLRVLARQPNLSLDQVPGKMAEITAGYLQMQQRIASLDTEDTAASELARQAAEAGRAGRFEEADRLLEQAEARETAAIDQRRIKAAQFRAARGDNAKTQLHYADAAHHYETAASELPESEALSSLIYISQAGDMWQIAGSTDGAMRCYQAALSIAGRLAKTDPADVNRQRNLSVSYEKVGDVQQAQGDLAASLRSYQAALAIRERLAKADPGNAGWQRDLSVSYDKVGDVQQAQGDLAASLRSYQAALAIRERLAKADPGNAGWQRDLAVSYGLVGQTQILVTSSREALDEYNKGRDIIVRLLKLSPDMAVLKTDIRWFDAHIAQAAVAQSPSNRR